MTTTLFLNYNANTETLSINTFRNNGYFNEDVVGLVEDIVTGVSSCCNLEGALDAVRDGPAWAGTNATTEILEMIDDCINEYEAAEYHASMQQYDKNLNR